MRILSLSLLAVLAACNAPESSTRTVQGQITDSSVQAVFAETANGQQTVAAVGIGGRFVLNVPVQTPVTLVTATRNVAGGFSAVKHIGPQWFSLRAGPLLDLGVVHTAGTGTIIETPGTADAGTPSPTHMCPNGSSSGSDDDGDKGDDGHHGDDGSSNSGEGMADGGSSGHDGDGSDCHESDDDTCGGTTVSGCGEDDRDDCDNEDEMQPVSGADAGLTCPSHS